MKLFVSKIRFRSPRFATFIPAFALVAVIATFFFGPMDAAGQKPKLDTAELNPTASVTPVLIGGNPNCATLNADTKFPNITTNLEFKIDSPFSHGGPWAFQSSGNRSLTGSTDLSNFLTTSGDDNTVNFSSTKAISAVMIKAGPSSNVYYYPNGSFGDTNLVTAGTQEISHVTFCYYQPAQVTIIKSVTTLGAPPGTTSAFGFNFDFIRNAVNAPFTLVDNVSGSGGGGTASQNVANIYSFGSGNPITVTEANYAPNWTLAGISCVETAGGGVANVNNTTTNLVTRTASIVLEQGEHVTCTFSNTQLVPTAASASVSGRALDSMGRGIASARITMVNVQSGQSWMAITNPFGYYTIEGPEVGNFYHLTITHKRYTFADGTRMFSLNEDLVDLDFVANP